MTYIHKIKTKKYTIDDQNPPEIITANCNYQDATHVITGVSFGSNAFLTFERATKNYNKAIKVGGKLQVSMDILPGLLGINGGASGTFNENETDFMESLNFKYYGDLPVDVPKTFEEARNAIDEIQKKANTMERVVEFDI